MPIPCVRDRSSLPQPTVPCDEFHEPLPPPLRSDMPTWTFAPVFSRRLSDVPCASLVQLSHVWSWPGGNARPSGVDPVSVSCRFETVCSSMYLYSRLRGFRPSLSPGTISPFSVRLVSLVMLLPS